MKISIYSIVSWCVLIYSPTVVSIQDIDEKYQLRGYQNVTQDELIYCRVTVVATMYNDSAISTPKQESCIPIVNWVETDEIFPITLPDNFMLEHENNIKTGNLFISIHNAKITDQGIETTENSKYNVLTDIIPRHMRVLQSKIKSIMTVAVIRISTSDSYPKVSASTIKSKFTNGINFMSQYNACSFGKLKWKLASTGVIDVKINKPISSYTSASALVTAIQIQMKTSMGISAVSDLADKVIMCIPPGTGNWAGSAGVNHWRVQMNNDWCTSLSGIMHELGHTIGLLHAEADGVPYNDRTGYMGSGYRDAETPLKCFNAYDLYKLGWYSTRQYTYTPTTTGQLINLATFVDFNIAASNEPVLINVSNKYFLQYNRKKGFNIGTEQKVNQVTITEPIADGTNTISGLSVGNKFQIGTLIIEACYTKVGSSKAEIMVISVALGKTLCGQKSAAAKPTTTIKATTTITSTSSSTVQNNSGKKLTDFLVGLLNR